jgi:hypothetical protein
MQDGSSGLGFSLSNIRGTPLAVLIIIIACAIGLVAVGVSFKGSVVV